MLKPPWNTALITGASSGIGAALARRLAKEGVEVVVAARRAHILEELVKEIRDGGGRARHVAIDVTRTEELVERIRAVDAEVGGLDLVVANAGIGGPQPAATLTWEQASPVFATNFIGAMATLTAILPRMVERGRGHLVGMSSVIVYAPAPGGSAYRAAKCGLTGFLGNLRAELGPKGVRVTAIHPAFVETPLAAAFASRPPGTLTSERAAEIIAKRLRQAPGRIDFPRSITLAVRVLGALPAPIQAGIMRRMPLEASTDGTRSFPLESGAQDEVESPR